MSSYDDPSVLCELHGWTTVCISLYKMESVSDYLRVHSITDSAFCAIDEQPWNASFIIPPRFIYFIEIIPFHGDRDNGPNTKPY
ncbi:hypothetical protein CEXT_316781 [Caerostris extrusa]|uniref:Uncharacterized protein n=1 Tax=Caerostris extrusa TaxID=172846 RepID=A0AAV4WSC8_CAEEX|nr:hypothetical protein CEXT_316781 [Caerostris extrusa]